MNARTKLNVAFINGAVVVAVLAGAIFNSFLVSAIVLVLLIWAGRWMGDIR